MSLIQVNFPNAQNKDRKMFPGILTFINLQVYFTERIYKVNV